MFFFSSRRRHTRSLCDWSSDVCSSDLIVGVGREHEVACRPADTVRGVARQRLVLEHAPAEFDFGGGRQIGRASCRERVVMSVVVGTVKKKRIRDVSGTAQEVSTRIMCE